MKEPTALSDRIEQTGYTFSGDVDKARRACARVAAQQAATVTVTVDDVAAAILAGHHARAAAMAGRIAAADILRRGHAIATAKAAENLSTALRANLEPITEHLATLARPLLDRLEIAAGLDDDVTDLVRAGRLDDAELLAAVDRLAAQFYALVTLRDDLWGNKIDQYGDLAYRRDTVNVKPGLTGWARIRATFRLGTRPWLPTLQELDDALAERARLEVEAAEQAAAEQAAEQARQNEEARDHAAMFRQRRERHAAYQAQQRAEVADLLDRAFAKTSS